MRTLISYIGVFAILALSSVTAAWGQSDRWDRALDSYQTICDRCILLREQSLRGDEIPADELRSLLEQVSSLRASLQRGSGSMSKAQKERFERIRSRYVEAFSKQDYSTDGPALRIARPALDLPRVASGEEILRSAFGSAQNDNSLISLGSAFGSAQNDNSLISLGSAFGSAQNDNSLISLGSAFGSAQNNMRLCHPEEAKRPKDLSFSQTGAGPDGFTTGLMVIGAWSHSTLSYGAMATLTWNKAGIYIQGRSNFQNKKGEYSCLSDGTSDGKVIWTSGQESHPTWVLGAGGIFKIAGPVSLYAGSGYGAAQTLWEDASGKWATVEDYSAKGICADTGIIFCKNHFQASIGISTITFKKPAIELGLGIRF